MGRGPVCGIMTRAGGPGGVAGADGGGFGLCGCGGCLSDGCRRELPRFEVQREALEWALELLRAAGAAGFGAGGATTTGGVTTTGRSATGGGAAGGAATTGGRAMTGPAGGLLAMAGPGAGATMFAPWRGSGTMRRGAGGAAWAGGTAAGADGLATATGGAATGRGGAAATTLCAGGGATTGVGRGGGAALAVASACLRSRIASGRRLAWRPWRGRTSALNRPAAGSHCCFFRRF